MPRKSSIHFKPVSNVRFAVSHSERTDLSEPAYLLPKEHQLSNVVVAGSLSENELAALFIQQKAGMTGQAKARGSSPFWEGVVVLADTDAKAQSANLQVWKVAYEKSTGHKVLHISIHLDEGYIDTQGKPQYNPHAHVIVSRMDSKNKVISLDRKQLAAVQDLTAETLKMERGSTLAERAGKRGRAHIAHREYREIADGARLDLEGEKAKTVFEAKLTDSLSGAHKDTKAKLKKVQVVADQVPQLKATISTQAVQLEALEVKHASEIAAIHEQNRIARQALKDSGEAKQIDYMALKKDTAASLEAQQKAHAKEVSDLKTALAEALAIVEKVPELEAQVSTQAAEIAQLTEQYRLARQELKDSKTANQQDYSDLKKEHEAAVTKVEKLTTDLAKVQHTADQVPLLKAQLEAAGQQIEVLQKNDLATEAPAPVAPTQQNMLVEAPKPVEPVFPRITQKEWFELPKPKSISERTLAAAHDVLVVFLSLTAAAAKQQISPRVLVNALEKLLANYITPEPPAPEPVKATPAARTVAPGRSGVSR